MIFLPLSIKSEPAGKDAIFHAIERLSLFFIVKISTTPSLSPTGITGLGNAITAADDNYFLNYSNWGMVPEQGFRSFFDNN